MSKATTMRTKTTDSLHLRALRSLDDIQSDVELSEATSETNQPFRNGLIAHCRAHVEETPPSQAVHEEASPPPSPPRLIPKSSVRSRRSSMRMQSMDDNYCDRLRSSSSFGWYDESVAFESMDTPQSTHHEMDAWRDHNGWGGMRTAQQHDVVMSNNQTYRQWKRFSDFKLLAEYAKISDFRESVMAWRRVQQTQRWFRCLDADYLQTKCMLLERFLAQLLFEVPTPSLLLTFVGALPSDFRR